MLYIAVQAPMAAPSVSTDTMVKPGEHRSRRAARRRSLTRDDIRALDGRRGAPRCQPVCRRVRLFSIRHALRDHIAFDEDDNEVRDMALRVLHELKSIAGRPVEFRLRHR